MSDLRLFQKENIVGIFRGFSEGGLEFHADIVLPYQNQFQSIPMHGQFLLVQLAHENEAVLGRITSMFSEGRLASSTGEDYGIRVMRENREVPDDLRDQYLKYRVNIRVLGVMRSTGRELLFAPSHRRLPHVGSRVAFLSPDLLCEITGHNDPGADLGFFALGEFIYARGDKRLDVKPWMQPIEPVVVPKFDIAQLVARRTFVFARAGFGKSNVTKLLFSTLYRGQPTVVKRNGRRVPVGTVIFDPDGEYFWPDDKDRPGLCDVPELQDKIVVFTRRTAPSPFYQSFVAGDIKLDIRRLRPSDVVSIALSPEKQEQQNVRKLKSLSQPSWEQLVNEIDKNKNTADLTFIKNLLHIEDTGEAEATAARSNMTAIVNMLHDRSSQMMDMLLRALRGGKLCVVDVSQLRGSPALVLSGLILRRIFDTNQEEFTSAEPNTIPTIAVIEEAQSVLGSGGTSGEGPYVEWVKEGRKYDLGAVMITQQPGSIRGEILSQGDNWFIFHLLSAGDLQAVQKANAHFSEDLLSALLNEPIPGHGVFWSSAAGRPYPISIRALSFEDNTKLQDPKYGRAAVETFASRLRQEFADALAAATREARATAKQPEPELVGAQGNKPDGVPPAEGGADEPVDAMGVYRQQAIEVVLKDEAFMRRLRSPDGAPWGAAIEVLKKQLPEHLEGRSEIAYQTVTRLADAVFGSGNWESYRRDKKGGSGTTSWIKAKVG